MKRKTIYMLLSILFLFGCTQSKNIDKEEAKDIHYTSIKIDNVPLLKKEKTFMELDKEDIKRNMKKYEREEAQKSDIEKYLQNK